MGDVSSFQVVLPALLESDAIKAFTAALEANTSFDGYFVGVYWEQKDLRTMIQGELSYFDSWLVVTVYVVPHTDQTLIDNFILSLEAEAWVYSRKDNNQA